jgi:hypothetical protein
MQWFLMLILMITLFTETALAENTAADLAKSLANPFELNDIELHKLLLMLKNIHNFGGDL